MYVNSKLVLDKQTQKEKQLRRCVLTCNLTNCPRFLQVYNFTSASIGGYTCHFIFGQSFAVPGSPVVLLRLVLLVELKTLTRRNTNDMQLQMLKWKFQLWIFHWRQIRFKIYHQYTNCFYNDAVKEALQREGYSSQVS